MSTASWRCYAAIFVCWIVYLSIGEAVGYSSTAVPDILSGRYGFTLRGLETWFVSVSGLSNIVGGFGIAPLMDGYGRKLTFLLMAGITAIGWLITIAADGVVCMFVSRIILGISNGAQMVIVSVYVSELTPKEIRGNAGSGNFACLLLGIAMSYVIGTFVNFRWHGVLNVSLTLLETVGGVLFLPETPRWLTVKGYHETAIFNLRRLRTIRCSPKHLDPLEVELAEMKRSIDETTSMTWIGALKVLSRPPLRRPLIVCQVLMLVQQLSATAYIKTFMVRIFQMSLGMENGSTNKRDVSLMRNPNYQAIIIGFCGVVGGILSIWTTDKLGRRISLISSTSGVTAALTAMAVYFWMYQQNHQWAMSVIGWLPLAALVVYNVSFGIGLGPLPYVLMSELFPTQVRSIAASISFISHSVFFFLVLQFFGDMDISSHVSFTVYAVANLFGIAFCYFFIPETKNLSLEGIQNLWPTAV